MNSAGPKPKVLIVDDSAVVRGILARGLAAHGLEVVGTAADPFVARDLILSHRPDVLTLDLEMPRMNGLTFLERLMAFHPLPVLVLSSLTPAGSATALRALELGAVEVLAKPAHNLAAGPESPAMAQLAGLVKLTATARVGRRWTQGLKARVREHQGPSAAARRVLALGASTGGTQALAYLMAALPAKGAGCLIVQHMPGDFLPGFAERLSAVSGWNVRVAQHGEPLREGLALLAPGDRHLSVRHRFGGYYVELLDGPPVNYVRPSIDVMMGSVARAAGKAGVGAILTGMGRDGAQGLLAMRKAGGRCFCQDGETSIIDGMPKEAFAVGAAERRYPLDRLAPVLGSVLAEMAVTA